MKKVTEEFGFVPEVFEPYAPDYKSKIEYCRSQIREAENLDYDTLSVLKNLDDVKLHPDTLIFDEKASDMKKEYLKNVLSSKSFISAAKLNFDFNTVLENGGQ